MEHYEIKSSSNNKYIGMLFILDSVNRYIQIPGLKDDTISFDQCKYHGNTVRINNKELIIIGQKIIK